MDNHSDLQAIYNKINNRFKLGTLNAHIISNLKSDRQIDINYVISELEKIADGSGSEEMYMDKVSIEDAGKFIKELKDLEVKLK